jgi:pyrroloquinoline quinone biosynthesis protein B
VFALAKGCAHPLPTEPTLPPTVVDHPYVVVLGTAQDGGVPHVSCSCPRCEAARRDPSRRRGVASIAVIVPSTGRRFLIDVTPDLSSQLALLPAAAGTTRGKVDRSPVDGVLLTHAHVGHYLGLAFFGFEAVHTSRLPVRATPRMAAFLRSNAPWSRLVSRGEIELVEMPPNVTFDLDEGVRVTPFAVPHRDEDSDTVGFKIVGKRHAIAYVPDTDTWATWSPEALRTLAECDTALLDGTFFSADELPGRDVSRIGHPLIVTTMDRLEGDVRSGRLRVFFTHLNHSNNALAPEGTEHREINARGFAVAEDGQRLPL